KFLSTKGRISDAEQSRAFVRGFQPGLWARIARRLELKFPDHYPDDPYPLNDIHTAAKFVLAGSISSDSTSLLSSHSSAPSAIPTTSTSLPQIKSEDLTAILEKFTAILITTLAGSKTTNTTRPNSGFCLDQLKTLVCIFCGLTGHFISDCLVCQSYINEGKCKKNTEGKIVLPNGQFTPRSIPTPSISSTATNLPTLNLAPSSTSEIPLQPVTHPYNGTKENLYLPPHECNFASTGKAKDKDGPSYHTQAPIQKDKIPEDVFTQSIKTLIITLTPKELLSLLPEVCTKWKEQVTLHHIQQPKGNNAMNLLNNDIFVIDDPYKTYISSLCPGEIPEPFIAAKESHSIRLVIMNVNGRNPVESVVDPGSLIIAMSEEVCHELGLAYDPLIHIPLQLANGGINQSVGLAQNVPCEVGSITLYMQIHIIRDPTYDILLG
ncbi:hypothetical protein L208DRAFT_1298440, partial [Tricholoma matsutake]